MNVRIITLVWCFDIFSKPTRELAKTFSCLTWTLWSLVVSVYTTRWNTKNWILPTECIYVFHVILRINVHFPIQHSPVGLCRWGTLCFPWDTNWIFIVYYYFSIHCSLTSIIAWLLKVLRFHLFVLVRVHVDEDDQNHWWHDTWNGNSRVHAGKPVSVSLGPSQISNGLAQH